MLQMFKNLARDEGGGEILEYVLIAGIVIVSAITLVAMFGTKLLGRWTSLNTLLP